MPIESARLRRARRTAGRAKHILLIGCVLAAATETPAAGAQAQPGQPPEVCVTPQHRQFDFWVGRWDVYRTSNGELVAHSLVERRYGGCAIRENWMPHRGRGGGSLNSYLPDRDIWRQTWVDGMNAYAVFEGGMRDGAMVLQGVWRGAEGPGTEPLVRIRWTRSEDGHVRQFGEISRDQGTSWSPFFDLTYRPSALEGLPAG